MKFFTLVAAVFVIALLVTMSTGSIPLASSLFGQEVSTEAESKAESELSDRSLAEARIRKMLNQRVDLIYDAEPFGDVRAQLAKDLQINIVVDQNLDGVVDDETEVSSRLQGTRLADGLRMMLRAVDATYTIRDGVLLIISVDEEQEPEFLTHQMVDVRQVLELISEAEPNRMGRRISIFGNFMVGDSVVVEPEVHKVEASEKEEGPRPKFLRAIEPVLTPEQLFIETVTGIVSPDSWENNGTGNCVAKCIGGVLVVRATETVADELKSFVQDLEHQLKSRAE